MLSAAIRRLSTSVSRLRVQAEAAQKSVIFSWPDGRRTTFANEFLLDHCRCERCFHPQTKQRLKSLGDFSPDSNTSAIHVDGDSVTIEWVPEHQSSFPQSFLERAAYDPPIMQRHKESTVSPWGTEIGKAPPTVECAATSTPDGILELLDHLQKYGFCLVTNMPRDAKGTKEIIERIGPIRETHYGGFWEFTANMSHGDLAYSSQRLPAHTDTTYFSDPAGLQIFHLLQHDGRGGETLLVDGFKAASLLSSTHFETLSKLAIPCHASGTSGTTLRPLISQPVLRLDECGRLAQIRWNNEDRGVLGQNWSPKELEAWYSAARSFEEILKRSDIEYWVKMQPGTMLIINNWRVMHGRSAFTGSRRMCGAYISGDEWQSTRSTMLRRGKTDWDIGW